MRVKKTVVKSPILRTDIYISRKSNFKSLLRRAILLCDEKQTPQFKIHALGAALPISVKLCLELKKKRPLIKWVLIETGTVSLLDEMVLSDEEQDINNEKRLNSKIEITLRHDV